MWEEALGETFIRRADELCATNNNQGLVNMIWAFATAGCTSPAVYEAARSTVRRQVGGFNPQGVSNTAWALATAGQLTPDLAEPLEAAVASLGTAEFKAMELSNLCWGFAKSGIEAEATFDRLAGEAGARLDEFTSQGIGNLLWAYATMAHDATELFDDVAEALCAGGRMHELNEQELSLAAWSYVTMGYEAEELFKAIAMEAVSRKHELNQQAVSNLAWAYAARRTPCANGKVVVCGHTPESRVHSRARHSHTLSHTLAFGRTPSSTTHRWHRARLGRTTWRIWSMRSRSDSSSWRQRWQRRACRSRHGPLPPLRRMAARTQLSTRLLSRRR